LDYEAWHEQRIARAGGRFEATAAWHQMALEHIDLSALRGRRILEIGCGAGEMAKVLSEGTGAHVIAADVSETAVRQARKTAPLARVVGASVTSLPFDDDYFDLVVSLETLEHVPDWTKGLDELVRVTKPGGKLVITTPNYLGLVGLYRLWLRLRGERFTEGGQPVNNCVTTAGRVVRLWARGLKVEAVEGRVMQLPLPGGETKHLPEWPKWLCQHGCTVATKRLPPLRRRRSNGD
jgi:2-polyprenyl-3-methyl-5-hydroxy-6-metoxy-1,4-benzoquinol methylase